MKLVIALAVTAIIGFFGYSAIKPDSKPAATGVVYYYPKANVYYDVNAAQYIFFDPSSKGWKRTGSFNEEQKLSLGEKAVISRPSSPVWKNNAEDRIIYSVNLYVSRSDIRQKFRTDSLNSLPKKAVTVSQPTVAPDEEPQEEEKEKKGIKKFFEKLFKGKKDKEDES